jgi:pantoate--beta-alanine ligase
MRDCRSREELNSLLLEWRREGFRIAFVPTMGALHSGHISLIHAALSNADKVLVSIFVNPHQFNDPKDFEKYPSLPEADQKMLEQSGCHALYRPLYADVFADNMPDSFNLSPLENRLEGWHRPGHFQGVAKVVYALLAHVKPDFMFLGLKDYQQYLILSRLTRDYFSSTRVIGCPTIRESNGLPLSSRNLRLNPENRLQAEAIAKLFLSIPERLKSQTFQEVKEWFITQTHHLPSIKIQYLELTDPNHLLPLTELPVFAPALLSIAFYAGEIRLIDVQQIEPLGYASP